MTSSSTSYKKKHHLYSQPSPDSGDCFQLEADRLRQEFMESIKIYQGSSSEQDDNLDIDADPDQGLFLPRGYDVEGEELREAEERQLPGQRQEQEQDGSLPVAERTGGIKRGMGKYGGHRGDSDDGDSDDADGSAVQSINFQNQNFPKKQIIRNSKNWQHIDFNPQQNPSPHLHLHPQLPPTAKKQLNPPVVPTHSSISTPLQTLNYKTMLRTQIMKNKKVQEQLFHERNKNMFMGELINKLKQQNRILRAMVDRDRRKYLEDGKNGNIKTKKQYCKCTAKDLKYEQERTPSSFFVNGNKLYNKQQSFSSKTPK